MLTFQYTWMLWGLLGLAVPILLHLIQRELFRPVRFPSIRFILKGKLPFQKRKVPRDLLLLAMRMLLFAALILALARPEWQPREAALAAGEAGAERIVFLVDLSASMGGWNSREEARETVETLLEERPGAEFGLVLSSDRMVESLAPTPDHDRLRELLDEAVPETVAGNHGDGLREALSLLGGEDTERSLMVVSDLQASAWETGRLPEVPHSIRLEWLKVGAGRSANAAVVRVRSYPRGEDERHVQAELRNFGAEAVERTVTLHAGNRSWEKEVTLPPDRVTEVSFDVSAPDASRGRLSLEEDAFDADNHYYFWMGRPPALQVLVLAPVAEEPAKAEELFFVERALTARGETLWLQFDLEAMEPAGAGADWSGYRAVLLLGAIRHLDDAGWAALDAYLENGGVVIVTPGEGPGRTTGILRERGLLDLEHLGTARADRRGPTTLALDWINPDSPLGGVFGDEAARSLQMVSLYRYLRLDVRDDDAEDWLRSSEDDPLLVYRGVGRGGLFFSAFPFETGWSDLPLTGGFLPLVRELIAGDLPADHGIVRENTGFSVARASEQLGISSDDPFWDQVDPREPGVHAEGGAPIEVNLSRRESVLETAAPVDLARSMRPRTDAGESVAALAPGGRGRDRDSSRPLWHWFALAAAGFFLLEMLIAAAGDRSAGGLTKGNPTATSSQAEA